MAVSSLIWVESSKPREPVAEVAPSRVPTRFVLPFTAQTREQALVWQEKARARFLSLVEKLRAPRLDAGSADRLAVWPAPRSGLVYPL